MNAELWIALMGAIATISIGMAAVYIAGKQNKIVGQLHRLEEQRDTPRVVPGELEFYVENEQMCIRFPLVNIAGGAATNVHITGLTIDFLVNGEYAPNSTAQLGGNSVTPVVSDTTVATMILGSVADVNLPPGMEPLRIAAMIGSYYDRGKLVDLDFELHDNGCDALRATFKADRGVDPIRLAVSY